MRILVTGGTGFTGSHLTRRLLERGNEVVVIDNQRGLFYEELKDKGADIRIGSVADPKLVDEAVRGCDVVHHVAAAFRKVNLPKKVYWDVNVEGTRNLLESSLRHGVRRFINCSTCGVHGDVKDGAATEESPIAPEDYYQYTKYEAEKIIPGYVAKGLQVLTLRPAAIYGPGDPERFLMLFKRVRTGRFIMAGKGLSHYHPLYIDNLVDAFELAAIAPRAEGQAYLIADDRHYSLNDLVNAIAGSLGVSLKITHIPFRPVWTAALLCEVVYKPLPAEPPLFRRRVDWFRQNRAFNVEKARKELGYQPKVSLKEGLARTATWYRENGYLS